MKRRTLLLVTATGGVLGLTYAARESLHAGGYGRRGFGTGGFAE